ncbi:MAG TPA: zinc ribbon domain-containing protein [Ktedonobacterales bacterium]|jgi:hypothetical protein
MKLFVEVAHLLWPSLVLAGLWLVVSLVAFWYARSTRRPVFLFSGIGALLMMAGQVLSPARLAYHYLKGIPIPGGLQGRIELLVGAYKYQIAIEAIGALFFLAGLVREVMLARRRARVRAAEAALAGGAPVADDGLSGEGVAASASPTKRGSERTGFSSGQTGQMATTVRSPLAQYGSPHSSTEQEPLPTLESSGSEQPCPRCQTLLSVDAQFCGNCGMQLDTVGTPPFFDERSTYRQDRASAHSAGLRSNEEFM